MYNNCMILELKCLDSFPGMEGEEKTSFFSPSTPGNETMKSWDSNQTTWCIATIISPSEIPSQVVQAHTYSLRKASRELCTVVYKLLRLTQLHTF